MRIIDILAFKREAKHMKAMLDVHKAHLDSATLVPEHAVAAHDLAEQEYYRLERKATEAIREYAQDMRMRLYYLKSKPSAPDKARQTYFSGSVRVDLKFNHGCKHGSCFGRNGGGCYQAVLRVDHYDWRSKVFQPIKVKLRHLHLSPADQARLACDSDEAWREAAGGALAFGSYWDREYGRDHSISEDRAEAISNAMDRTDDGEPMLNGTAYPEFTDWGGYPIVYVTRDGSEFCGKCAPRHCENSRRTASVHYEGAPITCEDCHEDIESVYGDPEDPEDDEDMSGAEVTDHEP